MKHKTLYVLRGPCGSGKTWLRTKTFPKATPVIDMEDAPRSGSFATRIQWLKDHLADIDEHAILEGIFAPGTKSWEQLPDIAASFGFVIVSITITSPIEACLNAVKGDTMRTQFVREYHPKFV